MAILRQRLEVSTKRSLLVGLSGIDGAGKGFLSAKMAALLEQQHGLNIGHISVDGWLNLPQVRFDQRQPAEHFYQHAIRFDEMFSQLILPLRDRRRIHLVADYAEEIAQEYRPHTYHFADIDIIILEGIYLFKRAYRPNFDLACWIDCTFQTALERALQRGQEGLPPDETIRVYQTIYFPAQQIHFKRDNPRTAADLIINNDPRLSRSNGHGQAGEQAIQEPDKI
jgi:uridine kinase